MAGYTVKVEHINPFIRATMETFKSMISAEAKPGKVKLKQGSGFSHDVSGIIGLSGGAKGSIAVSFPRLTALKVVSAFVGEKVVTMDENVVDAIGELANIIADSANKELSQHNINISLPSVVMGENHQVMEPKDVIAMVVPFESPHGTFDLAVCFKSET